MAAPASLRHPKEFVLRARERTENSLPRLDWTLEAGSASPAPSPLSAPETQPRDQRFVALPVDRLDVVEEPPALRHHFDESTPRMIVLDVRLEVFGQVV